MTTEQEKNTNTKEPRIKLMSPKGWRIKTISFIAASGKWVYELPVAIQKGVLQSVNVSRGTYNLDPNLEQYANTLEVIIVPKDS